MDQDLEKRIASQVFEQAGITIDSRDPIYALAIICKEIIKEDKQGYQVLQQDIIKEIQLLPYALTKSLEKTALMVENAEEACSAIGEKTRTDLEVLSKLALDKTASSLDIAVRDQVAVALSQIKISFDAMEIRSRGFSAGQKGLKGLVPTLVLSAGLAVCIAILPPVMYFQSVANRDRDKHMEYYVRELISQERAISKMPPSVQQTIKQYSSVERQALSPK